MSIKRSEEQENTILRPSSRNVNSRISNNQTYERVNNPSIYSESDKLHEKDIENLYREIGMLRAEFENT